ncbi:MAG: hypothetical protein ACYDAG_12650, partial [Chloroflexota bacterium]
PIDAGEQQSWTSIRTDWRLSRAPDGGYLFPWAVGSSDGSRLDSGVTGMIGLTLPQPSLVLDRCLALVEMTGLGGHTSFGMGVLKWE